MAKGNIIQTKRHPTEFKKILPNTHLLEGKYQKVNVQKFQYISKQNCQEESKIDEKHLK